MKSVKLSESVLSKSQKAYENCTGCNACMKHCPMLEEFCQSPKKLLRHIITIGKINPSIPYSCALCSYCESICNRDVSLNNLFLDMRMDIYRNNKDVVKNFGYNTVKNHQKNSFSTFFSTSIKGLSGEKGVNSRSLFFPGCSLTSYSPDIVLKTYKYLMDKLPEVGIMQNCCGNPTYSIGDINQFNKYIERLEKEFCDNGIDEIIVACQNCYKTFERNSSIKVISLWEIISRFGIPEDLKKIGKGLNVKFSIHDPCPTRDNSLIHESIRDIAKQLGLNIVEMDLSREKTLCCGSGGMLNVTNSTLAQNQMKKRAEQSEASCIITYCEECVESMKRGGKQSLHVLDLLFNTRIYTTFNQSNKGTLRKWLNRYVGKRKISKLKKRIYII